MNRLCLFLRPCICTHIYACVFTSTWSAEGWWFVVYSISCIFSALQRRDWWISTAKCWCMYRVRDVLNYPEVELTHCPQMAFLFHGWDLLAPRVLYSLLVEHPKHCNDQAQHGHWQERERDQLHVSRSFFVQLIYSDKTPTLKSSIFLIVTLNASLSSRRFNCFYVSCFQGLPPVNRTCFFLPQLQLEALSDHRARLCCRFAGQKFGDVRPEAQPWTVKREVKTCFAFSGGCGKSLKFNGLPWALQCLLTYYPYRTCHPEMLFLLVFFGLPNVVRLGFTWASEVNTLSFDLPPETLQAFYCCYYHRKIPVWFRGYIITVS